MKQEFKHPPPANSPIQLGKFNLHFPVHFSSSKAHWSCFLVLPVFCGFMGGHLKVQLFEGWLGTAQCSISSFGA